MLVNCETCVSNAGARRNKTTLLNEVRLGSSRCSGPYKGAVLTKKENKNTAGGEVNLKNRLGGCTENLKSA